MKARAALALLATAALSATSAEPARAEAPATWHSRMASAVRYAEGRAGTISFAVVDESGRLRRYHARAVAPSASLLKAMLLVAYLRRSDVRDRALAAWERDLLGPMIRRSDNAAAATMAGLVGERRLDRLADLAGMEHFRFHWPVWGTSEVTPRGQALYFRRIDSLVPRRHRAYAMHLLATIVSSQRWGVGRVPQDRWRLYFKGGWSSGTGLVDHQVALYRAGGERFSLALFTRFDPDHEYGKETLRGLAARLLEGVAHPGRRLSHVGRAALDGRYLATASKDCSTVTIRPRDEAPRRFASGASSCARFRLASAGDDVLWSWPEGGGTRLATSSYAAAGASDLGSFDSSDPLGPLAGKGRTLAYAHGSEVSIVGGADCAVEASSLALGGGRVVAVSGATIQVFDPGTCAVQRSLHVTGTVLSVALDDAWLVWLARGPTGRHWLQRVRLSSGDRLGRMAVPVETLPKLAVHRGRVLYRTPHALRILSAHSGRSWTVWRPAVAPVAAWLSGRRVVWIENGRAAARLWSLWLPDP